MTSTDRSCNLGGARCTRPARRRGFFSISPDAASCVERIDVAELILRVERNLRQLRCSHAWNEYTMECNRCHVEFNDWCA